MSKKDVNEVVNKEVSTKENYFDVAILAFLVISFGVLIGLYIINR